jgi:hypothetical protein
MPLRRLLSAAAAAASFSAAFVAVHAQITSPVAGVSTAVSVASTRVPNADHLTTTPAPIPAPTPMPTPAPTPVPVVQQAVSQPAPVVPHPVTAAPPPAPVVHFNYLTSGDGTLHTSVGVYTDCTGRTELTHTEAAIDTCIPGPTYFVGHNVGVFTPLMHMGVGSIITYWDGNGIAHVWRVAYVIPNWTAANGVPPAQGPGVVAQFQTCVVADGSVDRILDVVPA